MASIMLVKFTSSEVNSFIHFSFYILSMMKYPLLVFKLRSMKKTQKEGNRRNWSVPTCKRCFYKAFKIIIFVESDFSPWLNPAEEGITMLGNAILW